jgi:DnaJ homolog subfamily C member 9
MVRSRRSDKGRGKGTEEEESLEHEDESLEELEDLPEYMEQEDDEAEEKEGNDHSSFSSSPLRQQIQTNFGSLSLYEILHISPTASQDEIRRAYRQCALKYHPDKGGDPEKFKALSAIHIILSNEDTRRLYDETGEIDAEASCPASGSFDDWYEYYRQLFPQISLDDIAKYEMKYKGSSEEQQDVWDAYQRFSGDLKAIMESVMFAEVDDEQRILDIIDEGFAKNILQPTPQFLQAKKRMAKRRSKTVPQPKQEDGPSHVSESEGAKGGKKAKAKAKVRDKDGEDMASLRNAILKRHSNPFENILSKYSEPGSSREDYEVDEDDFMRTQEKMMKKKGGGERDTMVGARAKPKKTEESKESAASKKRKK